MPVGRAIYVLSMETKRGMPNWRIGVVWFMQQFMK